jgi:hypothetical protein
MQKALQIEVKPNFTGYSESLITLSIQFQQLTLNTELKLKELIDQKVKYYYFPIQRLLKSNMLIVSISEMYGFESEMIDQNVGKPSVVVRRGKTEPSVPLKLLSEVAKNYDPEVLQEYVIREVEEVKVLEFNGVYVEDVGLEISEDEICKDVRSVLEERHSAQLFWMADDCCFVLLNIKAPEEPKFDLDTVESISKDEDIESKEESSQAIEDLEPKEDESSPEIIYSRVLKVLEKYGKLENIIVSPVGGIRFQSSRVENFKKRSQKSFRFGEAGWVQEGPWKSQGVNIK